MDADTKMKMGRPYQAVIVTLVGLTAATLWDCYEPEISGATAVAEAARRTYSTRKITPSAEESTRQVRLKLANADKVDTTRKALTSLRVASIPVRAYPMDMAKPGTLGYWKTMSKRQRRETVVALIRKV